MVLCIYTHTDKHIHTYTGIHTGKYRYLQVDGYVDGEIGKHRHTHTHTHTHTYIYIYIFIDK